MSTLSLRLPKSLHVKIRELAERENISINQFVATAAAEKAAALLTVEYLEDRARRGDPTLFDRVLDRVPDVPPVVGDELSGEPPATDEAAGRVGGSNFKRDTKRKRRRAR
jgi:uncharacterized protein (DUF1778 family)